ncbi:S1C family serine protease, partial [Streptomyces nanshensis]
PGPPPGGKRVPGGLLAAILVGALVAGGIGGGIGFWAADQEDGSSTTISSGSDSGALNRSPKSVAGIAGKTLPSVVTIETKGGGEEGTGTGFVFDKQGHILTNNHVVASGSDGGLSATFSDGKKYEAEVVGKAQGYDVAVIKLKNADDRKLSPLPLGKSNDVQVGDATIAIGAPFGLSGTVTTGIVSAKNRPVASSDGQGSNASYMNALQTDASINPGNSGGPLLNAQGAVIGVNSAIQSAGGGDGGLGQGGQSGSIGLGFAIPVNQAKRVATQLIKTGTPVYPVIGATVTMDQQDGGAVIADRGEGSQPAITKDGPADKAGLKPGDVITKLDDTTIDSGPTLIGTIWTHKPGEKVKITYKRGGKESTTDVTLGSRKGDQ